MVDDIASQPTDWPVINADAPNVTSLMQQNAELIKQYTQQVQLNATLIKQVTQLKGGKADV